jgi:hypothetical protein
MITGITRTELCSLYEHWVKFSNAYFWRPPPRAGERREEEKKQNLEKDFWVNDTPVKYHVSVRCTCGHYYAYRRLWVGGKLKPQGSKWLKKWLSWFSSTAKPEFR